MSCSIRTYQGLPGVTCTPPLRHQIVHRRTTSMTWTARVQICSQPPARLGVSEELERFFRNLLFVCCARASTSRHPHLSSISVYPYTKCSSEKICARTMTDITSVSSSLANGFLLRLGVVEHESRLPSCLSSTTKRTIPNPCGAHYPVLICRLSTASILMAGRQSPSQTKEIS